MQILIGFCLAIGLVVVFVAGYTLGQRKKKLKAEEPTEQELRKIEDLNRQAEELFNYSTHKAYGGN